MKIRSTDPNFHDQKVGPLRQHRGKRWACNTISTNTHHWPIIAEAQKRAAEVVVVDPVRARTARQADWHIATVDDLELPILNFSFLVRCMKPDGATFRLRRRPERFMISSMISASFLSYPVTRFSSSMSCLAMVSLDNS